MIVNIKYICEKNKGWSLYDLARVLSQEGISKSAIYSWSSGLRMPRRAQLDMLCTLLDCSLSDLFVVEPYKFKNETVQAIAEKGKIYDKRIRKHN